MDNKNKKTILIIEDELYHRQVLEKILTQNDFLVESAVDGAEGLKKAFEIKPDLIVLDLLLPALTGFAVLEKLKASETTKDIKVVILSNLGDEYDVKKGLQLGVEQYFVKANWTPQQIVDKIKELLIK